MALKEFMFLISTLVPNAAWPRGRTCDSKGGWGVQADGEQQQQWQVCAGSAGLVARQQLLDRGNRNMAISPTACMCQGHLLITALLCSHHKSSYS